MVAHWLMWIKQLAHDQLYRPHQSEKFAALLRPGRLISADQSSVPWLRQRNEVYSSQGNSHLAYFGRTQCWLESWCCSRLLEWPLFLPPGKAESWTDYSGFGSDLVRDTFLVRPAPFTRDLSFDGHSKRLVKPTRSYRCIVKPRISAAKARRRTNGRRSASSSGHSRNMGLRK